MSDRYCPKCRIVASFADGLYTCPECLSERPWWEMLSKDEYLEGIHGMTEIIKITDDIQARLVTTRESGQAQIILEATDTFQSRLWRDEDEQRLILFLPEAKALYEALPEVLARLAALEVMK